MPFDLPVSSCPYCHSRIESATDGITVQRMPRMGDLMVCLNCAGLLKLDEHLQVVPLPDGEFTLLSPANQAGLLEARHNVRAKLPLLRQALKRDH